jgi:hypothetical protein
MNLDASLRKTIYEFTLAHGTPPSIAQLQRAMKATEADVRASLHVLAAARMVVLQPASGELLMVPPFSAVPTPFVVATRQYSAYANCAWDALGIPVMTRGDAEIAGACGCCGESIALSAKGSGTPLGNAVIHFAVPARRWWEDIVFT